jgi:hypothetical protein
MLILLLITSLNAYTPQYYYNDYIKLYPSNSKIKIVFTNDIDRSNTYALCLGNTIYIQEFVWERLKENKRKELMYHELDHCIRGFVHNNKMSPILEY